MIFKIRGTVKKALCWTVVGLGWAEETPQFTKSIKNRGIQIIWLHIYTRLAHTAVSCQSALKETLYSKNKKIEKKNFSTKKLISNMQHNVMQDYI